MKKLCIVNAMDKVVWAHNTNFVSQIIDSYCLLYKKFEIHNFTLEAKESLDETSLKDIAEQIKNTNPDIIVFSGVCIENLYLLKYIKNLEIQIIIHVYGNMACHLHSWLDIEPLLNNRRIKLVSCSHALESFSRKMLDLKEKHFVSPYLRRDTGSFYFSKFLRAEYREKLKLNNSNVFLYSGRVSFQKNVDQLILAFADFAKRSRSNKVGKLIVLGKFDDFFVPSMAALHPIQRLKFRERFLFWYKTNIPRDIQKNIHFIENASADEINGYYCAADYLVSLSTFYWEDFGLSIQEAKCCGLPSILTEWGGYKDHSDENYKVNFVPTASFEKNEFRVLPNNDELASRLFEAEENIYSDKVREKLSTHYLNKFSKDSLAKHLNSIIDAKINKFSGFGNKAYELSKEYDGTSPFSTLENVAKTNQTYKRLLAGTFN